MSDIFDSLKDMDYDPFDIPEEDVIEWIVPEMTDEIRKKISDARKGKKHSDETRRKMSEAQKGEKNHMWGRQFTPEEIEQKRAAGRKGGRKKGCTPWNKGKRYSHLKNHEQNSLGERLF